MNERAATSQSTCLLCDQTDPELTQYKRSLDSDAEGVYIPSMTGDLTGFDLDQWLLDTTLYGCPEDRLLLLSVEYVE